MRCKCFILVACLAAVLTDSSWAGFPSQTNVLISNLGSCSTKAQPDIDCITTVRNGLDKASGYIQQVQDMRKKIQTVLRGISTFKKLLVVANYIPPVKLVVQGLKVTLLTAETQLKSALGVVQQLEKKLWVVKRKLDSGVTNADRVTGVLTDIQEKCSLGQDIAVSARDCVDGESMTSVANTMELVATTVNPSFSSVLKAFGLVGKACSTAEQFINRSLNKLNLEKFMKPMNEFYSSFESILEFLQKAEDMLNEEYCVSNPVDAVVDWGKKVGDKIKNLDIFGKRERLVKKDDICFSVQKILDHVNSFAKPLLDLVDKLMNKLLSSLPPLTLPGLPNFDDLLNLKLDVSVPDLSFSFSSPDDLFFAVSTQQLKTWHSMSPSYSGFISVRSAATIPIPPPNACQPLFDSIGSYLKRNFSRLLVGR